MDSYEIRLNGQSLLVGTQGLIDIFANLSGQSFRPTANQSFNYQQSEYKRYLQLMQCSLQIDKWHGCLELVKVGDQILAKHHF